MAMFINKETMEKSCRLCMARFAKYNILAFKSRNLVEEINYCTGIIISQTDSLSTKICTKCLKDLTVAYKFKKLCLETDNMLRKPLTLKYIDSQNIGTAIYSVSQKIESYILPDNHKSESNIYTSDRCLKQARNAKHKDKHKIETEIYPVSQKSEADSLLTQAETIKYINSQKIDTDIYPDSQKLDTDIHPDSQKLETDTDTVSHNNDIQIEIKQEISRESNVDEKLPNVDTKLINDNIELINDDMKAINDDPDDGIKSESDETDNRTLVIEYLDEGVLKINDDDKLKIEKLENEVTKDVELENEVTDDEESENELTDDQVNDKDGEWIYDEHEEDSEDHTIKLQPIKKRGRFWQLKCTRCSIHFNHYTNYVKHNVKVHSERESYVCEVCGHNTRSYDAYSRHRKLHKAAKYHCDSCDYKSCYKNNLIVHIATHSTDRKYQCEHCGDTFRTQRSRYNHVRLVHMNRKRSRCEKCNKLFSDKYKLRRHMDTHFNIKRHECEVCLVKYTDRANLKKHMWTAHNVAIPRLPRQNVNRSYDPNYQ